MPFYVKMYIGQGCHFNQSFKQSFQPVVPTDARHLTRASRRRRLKQGTTTSQNKRRLAAPDARAVIRILRGSIQLSDLSFIEKSRLESLLGMESGYVLNFTNRSFQQFFVDSVRRDIYDKKYDYASGSKANRLRKFWEIEPNHIVGKVLSDLFELALEYSRYSEDPVLTKQCRQIVERLLQGAPIQELDVIGDDLNEKDLEVLFKTVRAAIDSNEPETGLDRLHTFVTKFLRQLCRKHGIVVSKDKPLHSLLGEYIKAMLAKGEIETQMTERILKSSIANLEAFNFVRNDRSFAHDNPILNYEESLLIFNNVTSSIRFIQALEKNIRSKEDDLPF